MPTIRATVLTPPDIGPANLHEFLPPLIVAVLHSPTCQRQNQRARVCTSSSCSISLTTYSIIVSIPSPSFFSSFSSHPPLLVLLFSPLWALCLHFIQHLVLFLKNLCGFLSQKIRVPEAPCQGSRTPPTFVLIYRGFLPIKLLVFRECLLRYTFLSSSVLFFILQHNRWPIIRQKCGRMCKAPNSFHGRDDAILNLLGRYVFWLIFKYASKPVRSRKCLLMPFPKISTLPL